MQSLRCLLAQPALVLLGLVSFLAIQVSTATLQLPYPLVKHQAGNSTSFTLIVGDPTCIVNRHSIMILTLYSVKVNLFPVQLHPRTITSDNHRILSEVLETN